MPAGHSAAAPFVTIFGCRALCLPAATASALRAEALRWIVDHLAAVQLREGALAEAAAQYKQLLALDAAALSGIVRWSAARAGPALRGLRTPCDAPAGMRSPVQLCMAVELVC
mgnify:CR=1 FL=1